MTEIDYVRSRKETAKILSISPATLQRLERDGKMPKRIRVSDRRYGYRQSDIDAFIAARAAVAGN